MNLGRWVMSGRHLLVAFLMSCTAHTAHQQKADAADERCSLLDAIYLWEAGPVLVKDMAADVVRANGSGPPVVVPMRGDVAGDPFTGDFPAVDDVFCPRFGLLSRSFERATRGEALQLKYQTGPTGEIRFGVSHIVIKEDGGRKSWGLFLDGGVEGIARRDGREWAIEPLEYTEEESVLGSA